MSEPQKPADILRAAEAEAELDSGALAGLRLIARANTRLRETNALLRVSEARVVELEQAVAIFEALSQRAQKPIKVPKRRQKKGQKKRHIFVALLSDTHSSEVVDPVECPLAGPDGHNAEIGGARMRAYFRSVAMLWREQSASFEIPTIVLALMGDFMVNSLMHEDSSTDMAPMEEVQFVFQMLREGIEYLLENTEADLLIPTVFGNHGRITPKQYHSRAASVSAEHLVYEMLASTITDKRITWDVRPQIIKTLEVEGFKILLTHGDRTSGMGNYGGGVGGLTIPFKKAIARWNANEGGIGVALIGHFHTPTIVSGHPAGFANGSLVGPTPYSQGMDNHRPQQWCFLVDVERQQVGRILPVWVD
jgi:hypothetical protein